MKATKLICAACLAALTLTGCSSDPAQQALVKQALRPQDTRAPAPAFVALANSGAPMLILSIEARDQAYAQFAQQSTNARGEESWISGDNLSLGLQDGVIIASRGFGGDMMSADVTRIAPLITGRQGGISEHFLSHLNGNDEVEISAFRCEVTRRGARDVDLGSYVAKTSLMISQCRNGDTAFKNLYWVEDSSGQVVQSKQWISPYIGMVSIRVIPPGR